MARPKKTELELSLIKQQKSDLAKEKRLIRKQIIEQILNSQSLFWIARYETVYHNEKKKMLDMLLNPNKQ
jgi:hypothetical protein